MIEEDERKAMSALAHFSTDVFQCAARQSFSLLPGKLDFVESPVRRSWQSANCRSNIAMERYLLFEDKVTREDLQQQNQRPFRRIINLYGNTRGDVI